MLHVGYMHNHDNQYQDLNLIFNSSPNLVAIAKKTGHIKHDKYPKVNILKVSRMLHLKKSIPHYYYSTGGGGW